MIDHCAQAHPMIHLKRGTFAEIRAGSGRIAAFFATFLALPLVLAGGICHVLYRTALLSQLVIQSARPAFHPPAMGTEQEG
jgi:hypothetical protein